MGPILDFLKKWSVLIVLIVGVVFNLGIAVNWWTFDNATWTQVNAIFIFAGLGSVRAKLADLFAGIDLGTVGAWITGKKTYILAGLTLVFDVGQAFGVWTATTPVWVFINELAGILGIGTFAHALSTYKTQALKRIADGQTDGRFTAIAHSIFNKAAIVALILLLSSSALQAQTWDYFWHPRKAEVKTMMLGATAATPYEWQFHPTFQINATWIRPSTIGGNMDAQFLTAAGPALTLQHTALLADGSNYADYSANIVFLLGGGTAQAPVLSPSIALTGGLLNNVVELGAGYDLNKRADGLSRFFFLVSVGINITNN